MKANPIAAIPFSKYVGCGNDFILIDNREPFFPYSREGLIRRLCHRQKGIGADGLILLEPSSVADFKMRIYNADGSEAEMCGNGIRCLFKFMRQLGHPDVPYSIETLERRLKVYSCGGDVAVEMGVPENVRWNCMFQIDGEERMAHYLDTGVPHAVLFVEELDFLDVCRQGREIRHHEVFRPKGANVTFVHLAEKGEIRIRTYERGVEGETLACGTGAIAGALASAQCFGLKSPVSVFTKSGEFLKVGFRKDEKEFKDVILIGPALSVFHGEIAVV